MPNRCDEGLSSYAVTIPGPSGALEGIVDCADGAPRGRAVICHPHPLYGGTMQNKVVHTLAKTLAAYGCTTACFNFRGVGASDGQYDEGQGEVDDALSVANWLTMNNEDAPLILAGFSFGAYIALQAAVKLKPAALITVAPPVRMFDFGSLHGVSSPWLLVQGDKDEVVDVNSVISWAKSLERTPQLEVVSGGSHFFHGKLLDLRAICEEFLNTLPEGR